MAQLKKQNLYSTALMYWYLIPDRLPKMLCHEISMRIPQNDLTCPQAKRSTVTCPATNTNTSVPSVWGPGDFLVKLFWCVLLTPNSASRTCIFFRGSVCKNDTRNDDDDDWWWRVGVVSFSFCCSFGQSIVAFLLPFHQHSEALILLRSKADHLAFWWFTRNWP